MHNICHPPTIQLDPKLPGSYSSVIEWDGRAGRPSQVMAVAIVAVGCSMGIKKTPQQLS